ncbi:MAG TPA: alpha/beta hydrolase [Thermomicrobiales bacterium]|jgi:non-heme chloroperoxidase|nr:alpha/beta hydrolase [Thermomicrobiales bacterium]
MPYISVGQENSAPIDLYYEDHGTGQPVVLIHGFPLNGRSWEKQTPVLLEAGYRVITYDRRGFGMSSQPTEGYDYDTFAADLKVILETLDLNDVILVGFSMGTGEVTRYLGTYGSGRVSKAVLAGPIPPYLLQTDDNPDGVPQDVFDGFKQAIRDDRPAFLTQFFDNFYNTSDLKGSRISDDKIRSDFIVATGASAIGTLRCVDTWLTDFRDDVPKIDVPTLAIQGDADQILPIDTTGRKLPALIPGSKLIEIAGGPHAIAWTHAEEFNDALMAFLRK